MTAGGTSSLDEYNGGPWKKGNIKFPDMGALAKKLEEKGVRLASGFDSY